MARRSKKTSISHEMAETAVGLFNSGKHDPHAKELRLGPWFPAVIPACNLYSRQQPSASPFIDQQDSAERAFNKLARTFAARVLALKRYRPGAEQKATVEHVHVHRGGQAIIGDVAHGPGGRRAEGGQKL